MTKTYIHTDHTGRTYRAASSFSRNIEQVLRLGTNIHHMRMGHYAVAFSSAVVIIGKIYDCHAIDDPRCHIARGSRFYEDSKRDRLHQIKQVRKVLQQFDHPLSSEVIADMTREEEFFA